MASDNYRRNSGEDGTVFVLQNIPVNYSEDLIINYVETTLDIDVKEVKLYPFLPGRALVYLEQKLEDFLQAAKKIGNGCLESKKVELLVASTKPALVVNDLDLQKLSKEFLCLYFESEFADGFDVIESSKAWPELNMAVVHFRPVQKEVVEKILEKSDLVPLPSEDYHISVQPFYCSFHDYIGQQMLHKKVIETAKEGFACDDNSEEEDGEEEGETEEDEEDDDDDEEETENEEENIGDLDDSEDKGQKNRESQDEDETDSSGESVSEEEDTNAHLVSNQEFDRDREKDLMVPSQKRSAAVRGGFRGRTIGGMKGGLTVPSGRGSFAHKGEVNKVNTSASKNNEDRDSIMGSNHENQSLRSWNIRGRGKEHCGSKQNNSSFYSSDPSISTDRKSEVDLTQRSDKPHNFRGRGRSAFHLPFGDKNTQFSGVPGLHCDKFQENKDHGNLYSPGSPSLSSHFSMPDMSRPHSTGLTSIENDDRPSSYFMHESIPPEQEISANFGKNIPERDTVIKKAQQVNQDKLLSEIAAREAKIKQLEEELAKKDEQSKHCTEKIEMAAWKKDLLSHCFGSFDDCNVHFDQLGHFAVIEGKSECVKEYHLKLLKELKKLKEQPLALTSAMHCILSKEQGKKYLQGLNSSQLNGAKAFIQDEFLIVTAKDDISLNFAMDFLRKRIDHKETIKSEAKIPIDKLNALQSALELKYLVKVSWSDNDTVIYVEGIKDDVFESVREIQSLTEDHRVHDKSFIVSGLTAKLFHKYFEDQIRQLLQGVEIFDFASTEAQVVIKFKGDKRAVNQVNRKLTELNTKVTTKSWDLRSEFKKPEDLMLITKGFTSEKMKNKVDSFEVKNKCIVFAKLPHSDAFTVETSKKTQPVRSTSKHRGRFKAAVPAQMETKLILKVTDTCQLVVKPYGDITKESSDVLVCVLAQSVNLRKTRVGLAFNKVCRSLYKVLTAEHEAHPNDAVLVTKEHLSPLKCQAICHIILTPWNNNSSSELSNAIQLVINQASALNAKSVSFPVLGYGRAFKFPASDVAQIMFASIKSLNLGTTIQKIVLLAPDSELFTEFKNEAPKHFQTAPDQVQSAPVLAFDDKTIIDDEDDESQDSEDDEKVVEMLPHDLQKSSDAEISIVALHDSGLENLWSNMKKEIAKICLHTDYFNQDILDYWPKESRESIRQEAKKLCVWVQRSPNPKTKHPGYIVRGDKQRVESLLNTIRKEFTELSSQLPKHRIKSDRAPRRGTCEFLRHAADSDEQFPSYWKLYQSKTYSKSLWSKVKGTFISETSPESNLLVDVDSKTKEAIKKLITKTWDLNLIGHGNDAAGLSHTSIKVTDVKRIENLQLFEPYSMQRKMLFKKMCSVNHICPDIKKLPGSKGRVVTTEYLEDFMKEELYYEINEHYLFHGTKSHDAIVANGIDPRVSSEGGMFGKGIYMAERFTKADQYTDSRQNRSHPGTTLYMILARALLGNVFLCDDKHKSVANKQSEKLTRPPCMHCAEDKCKCTNQTLYDSVMGNGKWLFREFVVYDKHHCYPEYLIAYQRV